MRSVAIRSAEFSRPLTSARIFSGVIRSVASPIKRGINRTATINFISKPLTRFYASETVPAPSTDEPDFSNYKTTTGLVGIPALPPREAREMFIIACKRVLKAIRESNIPQDAGYRFSVDRMYSYRLEVAEKHKDPRDIERIIDCGQIEELIMQAEDELELIPVMEESKPWNVDPKRKVPIIIRVTPGADIPMQIKSGEVKATIIPSPSPQSEQQPPK